MRCDYNKNKKKYLSLNSRWLLIVAGGQNEVGKDASQDQQWAECHKWHNVASPLEYYTTWDQIKNFGLTSSSLIGISWITKLRQHFHQRERIFFWDTISSFIMFFKYVEYKEY